MKNRAGFILPTAVLMIALAPAAQAIDFSFGSIFSDVVKVVTKPVQSTRYILGLTPSIPSTEEDVVSGCDNITRIKSTNPKNNKTKTKYPIVMAHGWFGFDNLLGVDYWYQIPKAMAEGGATIYVTQQSAMNGTIVRGDQLLTKIRCILAMEGAEKVNLIGHSQGAMDSRYVAGEAPELIASVTSVQGINHGVNFSRMYDTLNIDQDHILVQSLLRLGEGVSATIDLWSGAGHYEQNGNALISPESGGLMGDSTFNDKYPGGIGEYCGKEGDAIHNGIHYYSWGGTASFTNFFDPFSYAMKTLDTLWSAPWGEKGDGLVSRCSSHLGKVIKDNYYLDHFDGVNQLLGLKSWMSPNPPSLYRRQAKRLKRAGL